MGRRRFGPVYRLTHEQMQERDDLEEARRRPPAWLEQNHAVDESLRASVSSSDSGAIGLFQMHTTGAQRESQGQHGPIWTEDTIRDMAVEDELIPDPDKG